MTKFLSKISINDAAITVCYLGALSVFIPLLPVNIETQPVLFIAGAVLCFWHNSQRSKQLLLFVTAFLCMVTCSAIYNFGFYGSSAIIDWTKFSLPVIFFYLANKVTPPHRAVQYAVAFLHIVLLILFLSGKATILESIFGRYLADPNATRGFSFLAYEPSYAATYLYTLSVCANRTYINQNLSKRIWFPQTVFIVCLLATKSLLGLIFIVILLYEFFDFSLRKLVKFVPVSFLLFSAFAYFNSNENSRFNEFFIAISTLDSQDLVVALSIAEPSGTTRLIGNWFAIAYGLESVTGFGTGSFGTTWGIINLQKNNTLVLDHLLLGQFIADGNSTPQAWSGGISFEFGLAGLVFATFFFYLIVSRVRSEGAVREKAIRVILMYCGVVFFLQSQISNPIYCYTLLILAQPIRRSLIVNEVQRG